MLLKGLVTEDFINYKKPSIFIAFPHCSFKCGKENCQNYKLKKTENIDTTPDKIVAQYLKNYITKAIVLGGLEPFDDWADLKELVRLFRKHTKDDIVIYSGYTEKELEEYTNFLKQYDNIIVKFGRYIPNQEGRYDEVLGVTLASPNQYARRIEG